MISIIVAADLNGVIGCGDTIPWHIPSDLKLFKQRTLGHSVILGRKTWDSLPRKPLPGRVNYVISRGPAPESCHRCFEDSLAGPLWFKSFDEAVEDAKKNKGKDIFIIGGEQIYKLALDANIVQRIILSRVQDIYEGDHYFHLPAGWIASEIEKHEGFDVVYFIKG
jgi:dihydrofolate reductase